MSNFKPNPHFARDLERETAPVFRNVEQVVSQIAESRKGRPVAEVERTLKKALAKAPIDFKPAWIRETAERISKAA